MRPNFHQLLSALCRHQVEFVVVGGVAAILEGAPVTTLDVDVVYNLDESNLRRLAAALADLGAEYRDPAGRRIAPSVERLRTNRVNLLKTRSGLLDAMQTIGAGWRYADLVPKAHAREIGDIKVQVLDLEAVIASKEDAGRDKDVAMLAVLRHTLAIRRGDID